jgi:hypothetical protein
MDFGESFGVFSLAGGMAGRWNPGNLKNWEAGKS